MEGIEVNFDTSIGKCLSKLADTVTRLADTQNNNEVFNFLFIFFVVLLLNWWFTYNFKDINEMNHEIEILKLKNELSHYKYKIWEYFFPLKFNILFFF